MKVKFKVKHEDEDTGQVFTAGKEYDIPDVKAKKLEKEKIIHKYKEEKENAED